MVLKQLLRLVCLAAFGMLAISIVSAFPLLESLGFSPSHVDPSAFEGGQYERSLLAWVDDYKLELTLAMFMVLAVLTFALFVLDREFRARLLQKLSPNVDHSQFHLNDPALLHKITLSRTGFLVTLIAIFILITVTYQSYTNQTIVKLFALGVFVFNLTGTYFFGSLKRAHQMERLANKLHTHIKHKDEVQEKLLQADNRLKQQSSSLAYLASTQLNKQTPPKAFFQSLIKQSAETLNVARVSVWLYSRDKQELVCEALFDLDSQSYTQGQVLSAKHLPHYFAALEQSRVVAANDVYAHSATQEFVADYFPACQIGAMLDATIWHDDEMIGVICHEHVGGTREWTLDEQNYAGSLADLARLTVELHRRQKVETDLVEHRENFEDMLKTRTASIENNAKLFRFLVERAPVTILYMNAANEIIEMNPEAERISGYSREEAIGKTYQSLFVPKELTQDHDKYFSEVFYGNKIQGQEMLIRRADGSTIELSVSRSMELDADGNPVIISIGQDISQQKALEASLIEAREAAESADRIKSMFVASMSHELRTPLNSIIGFLGVVLQGMSGELNPKQKDQLGRAYASSKHLLSLISDVIDISKIEAGFLETHRASFDVKVVMDEVTHAVQHLATERNLELQVECPDDITLNSDRKRFYQVLLNVVSNGLKYAEKGYVKVIFTPLDDMLEITVEDTGIGMDEPGLKKLFKPFERIESRLKIKTLGTGLGLYLTYKILTLLLGGTITVKSKVEQGSTFTMRLPYQMPTIEAGKQVNILEGS
ncbi:MAG: ATP-binding protein [Methylophilus sp.]|nr:ATP-binding protein [Methylophilus sp.]